MAPISINMLTMNATLYPRGTLDEDRQATWGEPIELNNIFLSVTNQETEGSNGKEAGDTMQLYYDCFNSRPLNCQFHKGDKVRFNDADYYIYSIYPAYTNGLHHYTIGLK